MEEIRVHRIVSLEGDYPVIDEVNLTPEQWRDIGLETRSWKYECHESFSGYHEEFGDYSGSTTNKLEIAKENALIYEGHFYGVISRVGGLLLVDGKRFGRNGASYEKHTSRDDGYSDETYSLNGMICRVHYPFGISMDGKTLLAYYENDSQEVTVPLPEGITCIGESVFAKCSFKRLIVPEGVTHINDHAFDESALEDVSFPSTLQWIGLDAFHGTKSLKKVTIPAGCQFGPDAFLGSGVEEVIFLDDEIQLKPFMWSPYYCDQWDRIHMEELKEKVEALRDIEEEQQRRKAYLELKYTYDHKQERVKERYGNIVLPLFMSFEEGYMEELKRDVEALLTMKEGEARLERFLELKNIYEHKDEYAKKACGHLVAPLLAEIEEDYRNKMAALEDEKQRLLSSLVLSEDESLQCGYFIKKRNIELSEKEKLLLALCAKQEGSYVYDGKRLYHRRKDGGYDLLAPAMWRVVGYHNGEAYAIAERLYRYSVLSGVSKTLPVTFHFGKAAPDGELGLPTLLDLRNPWSIAGIEQGGYPAEKESSRKEEGYFVGGANRDDLRVVFTKYALEDADISQRMSCRPVNKEFIQENFDNLDDADSRSAMFLNHMQYHSQPDYFRPCIRVDLSSLGEEQKKHLEELEERKKPYLEMAKLNWLNENQFTLGIYPGEEFVPSAEQEKEAVESASKKEGVIFVLNRLLYCYEGKFYLFKPLTWNVLAKKGEEMLATVASPIDPSFFLGNSTDAYLLKSLYDFLNGLFKQFALIDKGLPVMLKTEKEARLALKEEPIEGESPFLMRPFLRFKEGGLHK